METKIEKYKMNFATKTLTITKAFAEEALNSESTALLRTFGASTFFMGFFSIRSCFSA